MSDYCQFCACKLWSEYCKDLNTCPDCYEPDSDEPKDLEDRLDETN